MFLFIVEREKNKKRAQAGEGRERQRILSRLHTRRRAWRGAWLHDPGTMSWAKFKSQMPNWLSHPGAPKFFFIFFIKKKFVFNLHFWERQRQDVSGLGQREREAQNLKQAPGSELSAQSLTRGLNSQTVRSWPESKSVTQPTEPPQVPLGLSNRFRYWSLVTWLMILGLKVCFSSFSVCAPSFFFLSYPSQ